MADMADYPFRMPPMAHQWREFIEHKDDLVFLDIRTERETNVYPMVAAGKGLSEIIMAEPL